MRPALLFGTALFIVHATGAAAQSSSRQPLRMWLESTFTDLGKNCLGDKFKIKSHGSAIPSDVREWNTLKPNLDKLLFIFPSASISAVFAETYELQNGKVTPLGKPLPVTWPVLLQPVIDDSVANMMHAENCSTFLAFNSDLKIDLPIIQAALAASASSNTALTSYFFAGNMLSPYTWALGEFAKPSPGIPRLSVLLGIWSWYATNQSWATRRGVIIRDTVNGLAFYSVSGLSQEELLSGDASIRFSYAFLNGGAAARGSMKDRITGTVNNFSTAVFTGSSTKYLPNAAQIAAKAEKLGQLEPASENPVSTDGTPFHFAATLNDVPVSFCDLSYWAATGSAIKLTAAAPTTTGACRFDAIVSPGAPAGATYRVNFGVEWDIASPPLSAPLKLTFSAPTKALEDERAQISLVPIPITSLNLPAVATNDPIKLVISYNVVEQSGANVTAVHASPALTAECDGGQVTPIGFESGTIQRNSSGDGTISVTTLVPAVAFTTINSAVAKRCRINGVLRLQRTIAAKAGEQQTTVPTLEFSASRAPAPVPAAVSG